MPSDASNRCSIPQAPWLARGRRGFWSLEPRHDPLWELLWDVVDAAQATVTNAQLVCDEEIELAQALDALEEKLRGL